MEQKTFLRLLILFLGLSYVLSMGRFKLADEGRSVGELVEQGLFEETSHEEILKLEEEFVQHRADLESNDYPGTGANNHHDPKPPGRT